MSGGKVDEGKLRRVLGALGDYYARRRAPDLPPMKNEGDNRSLGDVLRRSSSSQWRGVKTEL